MAQLMRCKSCGFILAEDALGEACPVCGVPRKMFEPFTDPVSARRRWILELHVHPIVVHFTVAFTVSAFAGLVFVLAFPGIFRQTMTAGLRLAVALLPPVLIVSYITGIYDARVRYRKARSAYLRQKQAIGVIFFCLSAAAAALLFAVGPYVAWVRAVDAALLACCTACAFLQGRVGGHLMESLFPG
jgi:rubredoxin/uncharacterized membrane protein